jgi:hypothetical protein
MRDLMIILCNVEEEQGIEQLSGVVLPGALKGGVTICTGSHAYSRMEWTGNRGKKQNVKVYQNSKSVSYF